MTMMKTRRPSITQDPHQDRLHDSFNLDPMRSHIQVLSTLYAHSQGPSIPLGDLQQGQALNDSTLTRNTRPTMSSHPTTKPTMTRLFEPACQRFCLPPPQSEASLNPVKPVPHRLQRPVASIPRLFVWSPSQWRWARSQKRRATARLHVPLAAVLPTSPNARPAQQLQAYEAAAETVMRLRKPASKAP